MANTASAEPLTQCLELIRARLGARLHSLWLNFNRQANNVILGPDFQHFCGPHSVVEEFGGAAVHYPPGAFGQSNLEIAELIVGHIRERIAGGRSGHRVLCRRRCHRPVGSRPDRFAAA